MAMNDMAPNELQLALQGMATGNTVALEKFYRHYYDQIYRFSRTLVCDDRSAFDVAQDTLMAVFGKPVSFEGRSKFSSYLCRIARNKAADIARASPAIYVHVDEDGEQNNTPDVSRFSNPALTIEDRQTDALFRRCLDKLPLVQKEIIAMRHDAELTETEIAEEVGCAIGTVKSRLSTARASLQKCLGKWHRELRNA